MRKMKISLLLIGVFVLFSMETAQAEDKACKFWNDLAYNLTHASEQNGGVLRFACNSTCNSVSCRGHFKAPSVFSVHLEEDLCFGLRLNQCSNPLALDYYIMLPDENIVKSGSISHNDSFDLPGPMVLGIKSTIVVIVEMVRVNATTIKFGVNSNVRAQIGGLPDFEDREKVLPEMYITVPPCTSSTAAIGPFNAPTVCTPLPTKSTQKPAFTTKKAMTTVKPLSTTRVYKSCELGVGNCKKHEMCRATNENSPSRSGICVCDPAAIYDPVTFLCIPKQLPNTAKTTLKPVPTRPTTTVKPVPTANSSVTVAHTSKGEKGGIHMTGVIIGAVFGGLLLIVVVVSAIIFIGRRRRQANYRGRHQLLSDNDEDDDTNVVI